MKYLLISFLLLGISFADEGENLILVGVGANFASIDGTSGAGLGAQLGYEFGFNEQTDLGFRLATSKHSTDGSESMMLYSLSFVSMYTPSFGDIRPRFGGIIGIQQADIATISTNFLNLGIPLQSYFDFRGSQDMFIEVQPGFALQLDSKSVIESYSYINVQMGIVFGLSS